MAHSEDRKFIRGFHHVGYRLPTLAAVPCVEIAIAADKDTDWKRGSGREDNQAHQVIAEFRVHPNHPEAALQPCEQIEITWDVNGQVHEAASSHDPGSRLDAVGIPRPTPPQSQHASEGEAKRGFRASGR